MEGLSLDKHHPPPDSLIPRVGTPSHKPGAGRMRPGLAALGHSRQEWAPRPRGAPVSALPICWALPSSMDCGPSRSLARRHGQQRTSRCTHRPPRSSMVFRALLSSSFVSSPHAQRGAHDPEVNSGVPPSQVPPTGWVSWNHEQAARTGLQAPHCSSLQ